MLLNSGPRLVLEDSATVYAEPKASPVGKYSWTAQVSVRIVCNTHAQSMIRSLVHNVLYTAELCD